MSKVRDSKIAYLTFLMKVRDLKIGDTRSANCSHDPKFKSTVLEN